MPPNWPKIEIPFSAGLFAGGDERAIPAPLLKRASNIEFAHGPTKDSIAIRKRKPYTDLATTDLNATAIANPRRLAVVGDELVLFTDTKLYSYSSINSAWVERSEYLAPTIDEGSHFIQPGTQQDVDSATIDGVTVFAWGDGTDGYLAAIETETGVVLQGPVKQAQKQKLRLVNTGTAMLVVAGEASAMEAHAIDVTDLAASFDDDLWGLLTIVDTDHDGNHFDVVAGGDDNAYIICTTATGYKVIELAADASVTQDNDITWASSGPVCIAKDPSSSVLYIGKGGGDGSNVWADVMDSTDLTVDHSDVELAELTGGPEHIAVSVEDDEACFFWTNTELSSSVVLKAQTATVSIDGVAGSTATLVSRCGLASRGFNHDGNHYVWCVFAGASDIGGATVKKVQLQNTYFLYRSDGTLIAKASPTVAGGFTNESLLPTVYEVSTGVWSFSGTERRIVPVGDGGQGYSDLGPRLITVSFDDDAARRTVELGKTLYITGGQVLQYDGAYLAEVGFHIYPWWGGSPSLTTSGSIPAGTYTYKTTWRWDNAKGERERSTTATYIDVDVTVDDDSVSMSTVPLYTTLKRDPLPDVVVETWRTAVAPATLAAPFYLTNSQDPADSSGDNAYVVNDTTVTLQNYADDLTDTLLTVRETNPENGGVLENLPPPAATIIAATDDRILLSGIPNDPHVLFYSKLRGADEIAAFHDALAVRLPARGGPITALARLGETLVVFKESAIFALPGDGFDNLGGGQNFGPAHQVSLDVGAQSQEVVGLTPDGLVFHSSKGWHLLDRSFSLHYIGAPVADYDSDSFTAVTVLEDQHQIRCLSTSRCLVYDLVAQQWAEWSISGLDALVYDGKYTYLDADGVHQEAADYTGVDYSADVELAWIKPFGPQGYGRVRTVMLLGEYRSAHDVRWRIARDYDDATYFDDVVWTATPTTVGGPLQAKHGLSIQKCEAISVRITDQAVGSATAPSGESFRLTGIAVLARATGGLQRLPAARTG